MKESLPGAESTVVWDSLESILASIGTQADAEARLLYLESRMEEFERAKKDIENALAYSNPQLEQQWRKEIREIVADMEEYERWHDAIIDMMEEKGWLTQIPKTE